ncbi:MAG: hypothetical protein J0H64_06420, partial [Actinobacteria bacterium]|nr:hypothetical protein [Actinomycetota bacterium]
WIYSNATDSQYLKAPTGLGYGALIYTGGISSSATKVRKNSAYNAKVGNDVYGEGAASGGAALTVVAVNQFGISGEGPGFQTDSDAGKRDVGQGDSGGPVIRLHTDGEYTPLGMVKGPGWKVNSSPREMTVLGLCEKGVVHWNGNPNYPRFCSKRSFHINTTAIESALGVDIYKP